MMLLTCAAVRRRLGAFHDRELPIRELIDIESHVEGCPPCAWELRELRAVGDALRLAAAPGPADAWTGLAPGVISRMRAEDHESLSARAGRFFEDLHLVWIGVASTVATFFCAAAVLGMLHFASEVRQDSLAAVIGGRSASGSHIAIGSGLEAPLAPSGSNLNPVELDSTMRVPTMSENSIVWVMLERSVLDEDLLLPLSAVISREGRVSRVSALPNDVDRRKVNDILNAVAKGRLEPAQLEGAPVAVNLVWLFAHTTVRGKLVS